MSIRSLSTSPAGWNDPGRPGRAGRNPRARSRILRLRSDRVTGDEGVRVRHRRSQRPDREGAVGGRLRERARPQAHCRRRHGGRGTRTARGRAFRVGGSAVDCGGWRWSSRFTSWRRCSSPGSRSTTPCRRKAAAAIIRRSPMRFDPSFRPSCAGRASRRRFRPVGCRCPSTSTTWSKRVRRPAASRNRCARRSNRCATTSGWPRRCEAR